MYVGELGALVDVDLFTKKSKIDYSFGTRFSFESYGYLEPGGPTGGGPFKDYCFYIIHSGRTRNFHFNVGGFPYIQVQQIFTNKMESFFALVLN